MLLKRKIELSASGNYIIELTKSKDEVKAWHISLLKKDKNGVNPVFDAPITLTQENNEMSIMQFELASKICLLKQCPILLVTLSNLRHRN